MTDIADYDVKLRSVSGDYGAVLARDLNREPADEGELRLRQLTVELRLSWRPEHGQDRDSTTYELTYSVNHDDGTLTATSVGDAHSERGSLSCQQLAVVFAVGDQAAAEFVAARDLDLDVIARSEHLVVASERDDNIAIHGRQGVER